MEQLQFAAQPAVVDHVHAPDSGTTLSPATRVNRVDRSERTGPEYEAAPERFAPGPLVDGEKFASARHAGVSRRRRHCHEMLHAGEVTPPSAPTAPTFALTAAG